MLPDSRRLQIANEVTKRGQVTVSYLATAYEVSEMTIHRDLAHLERNGLVRKVFGGAMSLSLRAEQHNRPGHIVSHPGCLICHSGTQDRTLFTIFSSGPRPSYACCPHCGLMALASTSDEGFWAITPDFITGKTLNVLEAVYVVDSEATPCCSPSVLCFGDGQVAERFQAGFGGLLFDFRTAMAKVRDLMKHHSSSKVD